MNVEVYSDFLRAIGHTVIQTDSASWFDAYPRGFLAFPYHVSIDPTEAELRELFRIAVMLRFVSKSTGVNSHYVACDQKPYTLRSLTSKARNQTRRGLDNWHVERVGCDWVAAHGKHLNADTLMRQGRRQSDFDQSYWQRFCGAAATRPGFEGWAAIANGKVGAVAITFVMGDVTHILLQRSARSELGTYPNNALSFRLTEQLLERPSVRIVFYGLRPLAAASSLDHFKLGMGYSEFPVLETFSARPLLRPLIPAARFFISHLARNNRIESIRKLAAALRYVQS
jgi:hypothetical protein